MNQIIKPNLLLTLKELALLGGIRNKIEISSKELAKKLQASQQTASRYLLDLDKNELIYRELGVKKQIIQITNQGAHELEEEFSKYKQIFDLPSKVIFKGAIISGMGEGKYYTEQSGYVNQFKTKLGFVPFPGTLNVKIDYIERNKIRLLKNYGGIVIDEFTTKNRTFGSVLCFRAKINDTKCAIVLPRRSHYSNVLEIISQFNLRNKFHLVDGNVVEIAIYLDD